ncbi:MAG: gamma carbonic anhydrase family protein [Deltaproteobacteria bacterium]|nr:gamma carbonic anhydrase family protein [Deltaproteobacteria bacterium]
MIRSFEDKTPKIAASAFISEAAYVVGHVEIGEYSSVWPGAVIRGDYAGIVIGSYVHIEDNSVVHCGMPLSMGDNIICGHGAVVHCARVGSHILIGSHATLLDGVEIGDYCIIAAGSLVVPGMKIPAGSMVMGVPAVITGTLTEKQILRLKAGGIGYAEYAQKHKRHGLGDRV